MYISEVKLREIIRSEIINEGYTPKSAYDEAVYHIKGSEKNQVKLQYLGSSSDDKHYFKNIGKTKTGKEIIKNEFNFEILLGAIGRLYGREISSSHKEKLKKAFDNDRIVKLENFDDLHDSVKYQGATVFDIGDMVYDTIADTAGSAAGLFGPGGVLLGTQINAAQAAKKYVQGKFLDGTISALGAIPIPGAQQTVIPGLKGLALFKSAVIKGGKAFIKKGGPNIIALIKGLNDLIETLNLKQKQIIEFITNTILRGSGMPITPELIKKISESLSKIIKDSQGIVDALK